jgi:hypothetical protein
VKRPPAAAEDDRSAGAVRAWVALYTRRLPRELAASRRELVESDLWDEALRAASIGETGRLGQQRWSRLIRGMPADLSWRFAQRGTYRSDGSLINPISRAGLLALVGLTGLYAAALLGAFVMLANPDPDRWGGWGPLGLAVSLGITIVGLVAAIRVARIGLWIGLLGSAIGMLAMPWGFYIFILAPVVLANRTRRNPDTVAPPVEPA